MSIDRQKCDALGEDVCALAIKLIEEVCQGKDWESCGNALNDKIHEFRTEALRNTSIEAVDPKIDFLIQRLRSWEKDPTCGHRENGRTRRLLKEAATALSLRATTPGASSTPSATMREALIRLLVENDGEEADDDCELCEGRGTVDAHTARDESDGQGRDEIGCPACIERAHSRSARAALSASEAKAGEPEKHERKWTGPGYLEQTGYIDPPTPAVDREAVARELKIIFIERTMHHPAGAYSEKLDHVFAAMADAIAPAQEGE